jgi:hypothetical protein
VLDRVGRFFAAVPGSIQGHLNSEELVRVLVTGLSAGGGVLGLLELIRADVGVLFPAPNDAALASAVLTILIEIRRRLTHGAGLSGCRKSRAA